MALLSSGFDADRDPMRRDGRSMTHSYPKIVAYSVGQDVDSSLLDLHRMASTKEGRGSRTIEVRTSGLRWSGQASTRFGHPWEFDRREGGRRDDRPRSDRTFPAISQALPISKEALWES